MDAPPEPPSDSAERRAVARNSSSLPVSITLENSEFTGRADNLGPMGVFFFSADRLRVRVEYQEDGRTLTRSGCLVRVQRMSAETTGYAVEFDR